VAINALIEADRMEISRGDTVALSINTDNLRPPPQAAVTSVWAKSLPAKSRGMSSLMASA
jgi:hypothetical protein